MDPNANLKEQIEIANKILKDSNDLSGTVIYDQVLVSYRLAELVVGLNEWIKNGGFLPEDWQKQ